MASPAVEAGVQEDLVEGHPVAPLVDLELRERFSFTA
jgi:hypothetical protein